VKGYVGGTKLNSLAVHVLAVVFSSMLMSLPLIKQYTTV